LKSGFDAHCACVREEEYYQASPDILDPTCVDELVVKEAHQILPRFWFISRIINIQNL